MAARSLGLTAYRALVRRGGTESETPYAPRPQGELVWMHAAEAGNVLAVLDLAKRLMTMRDRVAVLVTLPESAAAHDIPTTETRDLFVIQTPSEHPEDVGRFLEHWRPDFCLWTWGALRPNLVLETSARGCAMVMIDADSAAFDGRRHRWLPDVTRKLLATFEYVFARSDTALRRLVNLGLPRAKGEATSALLAGGQALRCADTDLADMSACLVGRPVWYATQVLPEEIPVVLAAHRQALRLSHRLLLILHTHDYATADQAYERARARRFTTIRWGDDPYPDETTQVMVVDDPGDRGLFFRVAPVSFLGSSLVSGHGGCDPFEAAALGSAVLYGPKVRNYLPSYGRLATAGAARIVNDAGALGNAVSRLIAPDQAATMAHAGWDVISEGAELADRVIELIQDRLDEKAGELDART
ncbi:3-deoxy-D-manno-octulosonic acid transferase [Sulfitobacter sp. DSM 110093]|uniref:3-deoxy-D-manno-octulosonic acid transferase n=1 Tax=Sulfitobacter sp. DSM 110093 TaxID=2883127 RepID=UPI001FAC44EA|nr:glycosyltransferase N-terminal domain-containing protein [Sulfitobacter sp. DSM 110093]UOA30687.1 3-deoxy-D-manno-octulosonic acid transferase [Sulfitobacter sp. DSM 110093]